MRFMAHTRRRAAAAVLAAGLLAVAAGCGSDDGGGPKTSSGAAPAKKQKIMTFVFAPRGFNDVTRAWFNGFDAAERQLGSGVEVQQKATSKIEPDAGPYLSLIRSALVCAREQQCTHHQRRRGK